MNTNKILRTSTLIGIIFTFVIGSLLHFAYDYFNQNEIVGYFSPINESTWEHLKLLFFPFLLYSIFEYLFIGYKHMNYFISIALGVITGMLSIIIIFYTYTGILGRHYLFMDILIFLFSVIITFVIRWVMLQRGCLSSQTFQSIGVALLLIIIILFIAFTMSPPNINLFISEV